MMTRILIFLGVCCILCSNASALPPLQVKGEKIFAGEHEIRLRGINWGWWGQGGTRYTENEMKQMRAWNVNVIRLAFFYDQISTEAGKLDPQKIKQVDEVVAWAKKYGVYVILDMHTVPGTYVRFFAEPELQEQFISLWRELAQRYKDEPTVGAYELMNEPDTVPKNTALLEKIVTRTITAIRAIDSAKIIVVSGDNISWHDTSLVDSTKQMDSNVLYTIHYYPGCLPDSWLGTLGEDKGVSGTQGWTRFRQVYDFSKTSPSRANTFLPMLRSTANQGDAWFDDLEFRNLRTGKVVKFSFDRDAEGFTPERPPVDCMKYDPHEGHNAPGSLYVGNTPEYNGWCGPKFPMNPTDRIEVSGWIKLNQATGQTFIGLSFSGQKLMELPEIRQSLKQSAAFQKRYHVPIYVGEFAVESQVAGRAYQERTTAERIQAFEELGYHWTYWNYRETTNPDTMALHPHKANGENYPVNAELLRALRSGWEKNTPLETGAIR